MKEKEDKNSITNSADYRDWLVSLKTKIRQAQLKAVVAVNRELLLFYWELGADLVAKQKNTSWGDGFIKQLSRDLMAEFPQMKGFSLSNLKYIRQWYQFYSSHPQTNILISQQPVGQIKENQKLPIFNLPWGHNIAIVSKCKSQPFQGDLRSNHAYKRSYYSSRSV